MDCRMECRNKPGQKCPSSEQSSEREGDSAEKKGTDNWLLKCDFYHGFLPRHDVPVLLRGHGDFLVRRSEKVKILANKQTEKRTSNVISVLIDEENKLESRAPPAEKKKFIKNVVVYHRGGKWYLDEAMKFDGVAPLFAYYMNNPLHIKDVTISLLRGVRLCRWEYVHRNIKVIRSIGRGAYGEVKLAELNRRSGEPVTVAAKTVNNDDNMTPKKIKEMLKEARIMRGLRHPNIVSFIGVVLIDHPIYIILEYMKAGALDAYLRKNNAKVTTDERIRFCMGVAWGMEYLHSVSILHRDLATRNCLYDGSFYVKIADFGLSRKGTVYKMRVIQKMPIRYMAPESLLEYTFSQKTDVYTFGIVIYEIFTSREPYPDIPSNQIKATIVSGKLNSLPNTVPQDLTTLVVEKMWAKDPAQRTDFTTIVQFLEKTSGLKLPKSAFDDLPTLDLDKSKARNTRRLKSKAVERVSKVVETVKGPMEAIIEEGENIKKLTNT